MTLDEKLKELKYYVSYNIGGNRVSGKYTPDLCWIHLDFRGDTLKSAYVQGKKEYDTQAKIDALQRAYNILKSDLKELAPYFKERKEDEEEEEEEE